MQRCNLVGPRLCIIALAIALAACSGDERIPLVIYSPHGKDLLSAFEARYEELHPDVDVQWLDMGSQSILDRVRSERANPQADIWWGAPAPLFETAAMECLLERFAPTWAAALPEHARDPNGMWHGTYITPEVIAFNSEIVKGADIPRDWDDVLDPKWKGKVLIRDPLESGTMRTIFGMIIYRGIRAGGDTAAGFAWLRRLDAQTKEYVLNPTLLYQKLARQEGAITLWDMPDIEELKSRTDLPIDYVLPVSGTPLPVDAVAIPKGSRQVERAKEFVEYIGGDAAIVMAARQFLRLPARADVPADSLPERLRTAMQQIVPEPMDWALVQQRTPEWMRHWDEHVRGRGR
jgi:iron(III) transport system substrate-binding protein